MDDDPTAGAVERRDVLRFATGGDAGGDMTRTTGELVVEEPLEVRVDGVARFVTMRTPGDDFDLAYGLAVTERLVHDASAIAGARWGDPADFNAVELELAAGATVVDDDVRRATLATAACGLCGRASIDDVRIDTEPLHDVGPVCDAATLASLPGRLAGAQPVFARTGGLHAAGLFDADGTLRRVREDVGRHNAVDKVVGAEARAGRLPAHDAVLCVSGRAGFEIVQKALVAGVAVVVAVSAPSTLAVDLAADGGITLAAFARGDRVEVLTHPWRVSGP